MIEQNQKFGQLTTIKETWKTGKTRKRRAWLCECACGAKKIIPSYDLILGKSKSCGCARIKKITKHGQAGKSSEYRSWNSMKDRCNNPNSPHYHRYGGRGIKVCERWNDFSKFLEDMGQKPTIKHTIERIDLNKNYKPDNCRWATRKEQANNRCNNRFLTYKEKTMTVAQWAEYLNIDIELIRGRLKLRWSVSDIFETPSLQQHGNRDRDPKGRFNR